MTWMEIANLIMPIGVLVYMCIMFPILIKSNIAYTKFHNAQSKCLIGLIETRMAIDSGASEEVIEEHQRRVEEHLANMRKANASNPFGKTPTLDRIVGLFKKKKEEPVEAEANPADA